MTQQNLYEMLKNVKGCKFAQISYLVKVTEIGKGLQSQIGGEVTKHCVGNFQIGYDYENAVNNRLEKQGKERNFLSQSLPWGKWEIFNKIIEHNGKRYLRFYTHENTHTNVEYFVGGKKASAEQIEKIKAILASKAKPNTQTQASVGLVEHQVQVKNIDFSNIKSVVCDTLFYRANEYSIVAE